MTAFYEICLKLQKHKKKSFFNQKLCDKNGECFSERKIVENLKNVSLSHQTVSEMADNASNTLLFVMNDCEYYSRGLDEIKWMFAYVRYFSG
jgi:hypothetical protein